MVDWSKPIELVDGTPMRLVAGGEIGGWGNTNPDNAGDYWLVEEGLPQGAGYFRCVDATGCQDAGVPLVRNRTAAALAKTQAGE